MWNVVKNPEKTEKQNPTKLIIIHFSIFLWVANGYYTCVLWTDYVVPLKQHARIPGFVLDLCILGAHWNFMCSEEVIMQPWPHLVGGFNHLEKY